MLYDVPHIDSPFWETPLNRVWRDGVEMIIKTKGTNRLAWIGNHLTCVERWCPVPRRSGSFWCSEHHRVAMTVRLRLIDSHVAALANPKDTDYVSPGKRRSETW